MCFNCYCILGSNADNASINKILLLLWPKMLAKSQYKQIAQQKIIGRRPAHFMNCFKANGVVYVCRGSGEAEI